MVDQPEETSGLLEEMPDIKKIKKHIDLPNEFKKIILFGATGFLGIHILYYLLIHTHSKIFCVIRKKDTINPLTRFIKKFKFYFPDANIEQYLYRIKIIEGNILEEHFGIDEELYKHLGNKCDCVIDTAALVKHYGNYELFNNTNVISTKRMIAFCEEFNIPLNYMSTMSVSGNGLVKTPSSNFTEDDLYIGQSFNENVYVRSKFEAERAIIDSCKNNNLIASIYRLGTITNRYYDGAFQENFSDNAFLNRLNTFINLGVFPNELSEFPFEFSPVDFCANFIVQLIKQQKDNLNVYHLYNSHYILGKDLVEALNSCGISLKTVSFEEFKIALYNSKYNSFGITAYIKNINNAITFHNEKTLSILKTLDLDWPEITIEYINKILVYLIKNHNLGGTKDEIN